MIASAMITFPDLHGWRFSAQKTAPGVYTALGVNGDGWVVTATGDDPDSAMERCHTAACLMLAAHESSCSALEGPKSAG